MKEKEIKKAVKNGYARVATQGSSCCSCSSAESKSDVTKKIGYTDEELSEIPEEANLGLGCGNPVALALLREGETVLDLGSGAGIDCFLAANKVGKSGRIIGVDMTSEMIEKARENAREDGYENVEFRLGEIENLPVADGLIDVVISNCVINLVPDKRKAFKEIFRVLKPGGRMLISDIVLLKALPKFVRDSVAGYVSCISGAIKRDEYMRIVEETGFQDIRIINESYFPIEYMPNDPISCVINKDSEISAEQAKIVEISVLSITVHATRSSEMS